MTEKKIVALPVSKNNETAKQIRKIIGEIDKQVNDENYTALAIVLIRHDGAISVSSVSTTQRLLLMGAIADMQYSVAKDGDR